MVQSWTSQAEGVACASLKGGLKAYIMSALGMEVANKCASICKTTPRVEHQYHEHIAGVWDDSEPHPVWRGHEEVPLVLVGIEESGCVRNNKWWTEWLRVRTTQVEKEKTKGNNDEESGSNTCNSGKASMVGLEAWSQKRGPKHACGLWCKPLRAKEGVVRYNHGHWMHLKCAGVTVPQTKKVFRGKRVLHCTCKKARPAKWLWETRARQQPRKREQRNDVREVPPDDERPKEQVEGEQEPSSRPQEEVLGAGGHWIVVGGRVTLMGMQKKKDSHHPMTFLFLLARSFPLYFPFLSLGRLCQLSRQVTAGVRVRVTELVEPVLVL